MPGRKFWSPRIEDIDPVSCMGYANVVLLCGINDVRQPDVVAESDVAGCYNKLKLKIKQIKHLSPSTAVFVCRLLPTKLPKLNMKVDIFNRLIYFDLIPTCSGVVYVEGFERFACNHVLADNLSKQFDRHGRPDTLHLNRSGARVLASLIKQSVFLRLNGGVDRRKHTSNVNGRSYSSVASGPPALQRRRWWRSGMIHLLKEICNHCQKNIRLGDPNFECLSCSRILHSKCFKPSGAQVINSNFYCKTCKTSVIKIFNPFKAIIDLDDDIIIIII